MNNIFSASPSAASPNAVCRDIETGVVDPATRRPVVPEHIPGGRRPVADTVRALFPNAGTIEHLGDLTTAEQAHYGIQQPCNLVLAAAHMAFARHYRLGLRPEVLMHLIVHEVAVTMREQAEEYRPLFTGSAERMAVSVRHDGLVRGNPESPWHEVFPLFNAQLCKRVPAGIMDRLLPGFSTATPKTEAAAMVAFMDAAQAFFSYKVVTRCGIPAVRLFGTPDDWTKLRVAASGLAEVFDAHLGTYFKHLLPVLKTLEAQARGAPVDKAFWASVYKTNSHSGTELCNGWLTAFVNYVRTDKRSGEAPRLVAKGADAYDWASSDPNAWDMPGIDIGGAPAQVCSAPFVWDYLGTELPMVFIGGPLATEDVGGYLTPTLSYGVLHAKG